MTKRLASNSLTDHVQSWVESRHLPVDRQEAQTMTSTSVSTRTSPTMSSEGLIPHTPTALLNIRCINQ